MKIYAVKNNTNGEIYTDTNAYFDFAEEAREQKFALYGNRDFLEITFAEFETAKNNFDEFCDGFDDCAKKYYKNFTQWISDIFPKTSGKYNNLDIHNYKKILEKIEKSQNYNFDEYAAEILTLMTSERYSAATLRGVCQSDWIEIIYPEKIVDSLPYIEACFFGTGDEYMLFELDDEEITADELVERVPDSWDYVEYMTAEKYKKRVADLYGVDVGKIKLFEMTAKKITKFVFAEI